MIGWVIGGIVALIAAAQARSQKTGVGASGGTSVSIGTPSIFMPSSTKLNNSSIRVSSRMFAEPIFEPAGSRSMIDSNSSFGGQRPIIAYPPGYGQGTSGQAPSSPSQQPTGGAGGGGSGTTGTGPAGGGHYTGGFGGAYCFTPDTMVRTQRGDIPIVEVQEGDYVLTSKSNWCRVAKRLDHDYKGKMLVMNNSLVTPSHSMTHGGEWKDSQEIFSEMVDYSGKVHTLAIKSDEIPDRERYETEHSFYLPQELRFAHNVQIK